MKKFVLLALLLIVLLSTVVTVKAEEFEVNVETAILMDADTGQVLFEKNADQKMPPASITKIMTLLVAMEHVKKEDVSLDDMITVSRYAESMGGSQIFLAAGTQVPLHSLLEAVTIASANDASVAVAEGLAGTYSNFVSQMNKKAEELGMKNSHFVNTSGLPVKGNNHYSTARDIAIMARELVKFPEVLKWASTWVDYLELPNRKAMLVNTNKLIKSYPGMDGLKTGHTSEAGFCLAATAQRNNMRLISVIMNAKSEIGREESTARLLDFGFNTFAKELMVKQGNKVQNIDLPGGKKTSTVAEAADDLYVLVKRGTLSSLNKKVIINEGLKAPIKKGDILGKEVVMQDDKVIGKVNLVATEDIARANFLVRLWRGFVGWIGGLLKNILG